MFQLRGTAALSEFRLNKLLAAVQRQVPEMASVKTAFVHFIDLHLALSAEKQNVLERLLQYGSTSVVGDMDDETLSLLVVPRPGTISPWSSKATDIAHNCGLSEIRRIERGVAYAT